MIKEKGNILLIVIGVVCILLLIGFFRGEPGFFGSVNYKKVLNLGCGLTVTRPDTSVPVVFPVEVHGYINGCGWDPVRGVAGTVQLFDNNGIAVTAEVPLTIPEDNTSKPYPFLAYIYLSQGPSTGTGSLIFKSTTGLLFAQAISF